MKTAIVIGAGFGGLALAIRLQSAGVATTIIEARDKPGGRAYVYEQDGFKFDGGPTVITDPDCLDQLWALSGRRREDYVEFLPVTPFYQLCWEDGHRFDYANDQAAIDAQIRAITPELQARAKLLTDQQAEIIRVRRLAALNSEQLFTSESARGDRRVFGGLGGQGCGDAGRDHVHTFEEGPGPPLIPARGP